MIKFRENQEYVINEIVKTFQSGTKTFILNAPTGSGKSIINLFTAKHLESAYITTPLRVLVDQYRSDLSTRLVDENLGWSVMGRGAYPCLYLQNKENELYLRKPWRTRYDRENHESRLKYFTSDKGPCTTKNPVYDGIKGGKCPFLPRCGYYEDRDRCVRSPTAVTTFDYFMWGIYPFKSEIWNKRNVLIIDEAHFLPSKLVDFYTFRITNHTYPDPEDSKKNYFDSIVRQIKEKGVKEQTAREVVREFHTIYRGLLVQEIDRLEKLESIHSEDYTSLARLPKLIDLYHKIDFYDFLLSSQTEMIFHMDEREIYFKPYSPVDFVKKLWEMFPHILLTSATFFGIKGYLKDLGLDQYSYRYLEVKSTFPPSNSPIIFPTNLRLSRSNFNESMPLIVREVDNILESNKEKRGIIHCFSYNYMKGILDNSVNRDRFIYHDSENRSDQLEKFLNTERSDSVLLSVNMGEGIDLRDDLARFQIIVKTPYPSMGDPWIKKHMEREKSWYDYQTMIELLQMSGRIIRSKEDYGTTYIIDMRAYDLFRKYWNELPQEFRDRINEGKKNQRIELDILFDELFS